MTSVATIFPQVDRSPRVPRLSAELLDGITDALISLSDPRDRAVAISRLVREMYDSVAWLRGADVADLELISLARLVREADAHQTRMADVEGPTPPTGLPAA